MRPPVPLALLLLITTTAAAAPPAFGEWLKLEVASCQPVVFEAPEDPAVAVSHKYTIGEKPKVILVVGKVIEARNFTQTGSWEFSFDPPATGLIGSQYVGFLPINEPNACPVEPKAIAAYVRVWGCDVPWRKGECLPPFPQLQRSTSEAELKFVGPALKR